MRRISFLLFALMLGVMAACSKEPTAGFTVTDKVPVNAAVTFTNTSLDADKYSWDFGDGTTSEEKDPQKTYTTKGTYTVKLIAKNGGKESEAVKTVTAGDPYPTKVVINKADLAQPWEMDGSGPDAQLSFSEVGVGKYFNSAVFSDLSSADFPASINSFVDVPPGVTLNNKAWIFILNDVDSPPEPAKKLMYKWDSKSLMLNSNPFILNSTDGKYNIELHWDVK